MAVDDSERLEKVIEESRKLRKQLTREGPLEDAAAGHPKEEEVPTEQAGGKDGYEGRED